MKTIFFNPCIECIVSVCCSQICEDKKAYDRYLPSIEYVLGKYSREALKETKKNFINQTFKGDVTR